MSDGDSSYLYRLDMLEYRKQLCRYKASKVYRNSGKTEALYYDVFRKCAKRVQTEMGDLGTLQPTRCHDQKEWTISNCKFDFFYSRNEVEKRNCTLNAKADFKRCLAQRTHEGKMALINERPPGPPMPDLLYPVED